MVRVSPSGNVKRIETTETSSIVKNFSLLNTESLTAEHITTTYVVTHGVYASGQTRLLSKKEIDQVTKKVSFPLVKVSEKQLRDLRKTKVPCFVLKYNGNYFCARIYKRVTFVDSEILGPHSCSYGNNMCGRLSARRDEDHGCAKIRENSTGIENYPWITKGYETFNTDHDCFVVVHCNHYEYCKDEFPKKSREEIYNITLKLAQMVWPDITDLSQLKSRVKEDYFYLP